MSENIDNFESAIASFDELIEYCKCVLEERDKKNNRIEELEKEAYTLRQNLEECEIGYSGTLSLTRDMLRDETQRANIAERALMNVVKKLKCGEIDEKGFCGVKNCSYYKCNDINDCMKELLFRAENQLFHEQNYR